MTRTTIVYYSPGSFSQYRLADGYQPLGGEQIRFADTTNLPKTSANGPGKWIHVCQSSDL